MELLPIHSYDADLRERYCRKFDQTKLVDLLELSLKNTNNYIEAIQSFIEYVMCNFFITINYLPEIKSYLEYHKECFRVLDLKCEHCCKYLDKSIDELTESYNQRLHLEETQLESDINEEMDEDSCELEETDSYKSKIDIVNWPVNVNHHVKLNQ
jgi:hypothetical protein